MLGHILQAFTALADRSPPNVTKELTRCRLRVFHLEERNRRMIAQIKVIPNHIKEVHSRAKGTYVKVASCAYYNVNFIINVCAEVVEVVKYHFSKPLELL